MSTVFSSSTDCTEREQMNIHKVVPERSLLRRRREEDLAANKVPCEWVLLEYSIIANDE